MCCRRCAPPFATPSHDPAGVRQFHYRALPPARARRRALWRCVAPAQPPGRSASTPKRGLVGSYREEVNAAIARAKQGQRTTLDVGIGKKGENVAIRIGSGRGDGQVLLIGFDHEHTTKISRGENGGRTLAESNVVRSIRVVGECAGKPLEINERLPEGEDLAVLVASPGGRVVGAARLSADPT